MTELTRSEGPESVALRTGERIAEYAILRVLFREELGNVYLAATDEGARVRLRVLSAEVLEDEALVARILEDLAHLQEIVHPNVARFIAYRDEPPVCYGLEHIGSATLFDAVYGGRPFSEDELVWLGEGLTAGLSTLHAAGLAHGNLSPGTITLTRKGPVIVDLGWPARLESDDAEALKRADLQALVDTLKFAASGAAQGVSLSASAQGLSDDAATLIRAVEGQPSAWEAAEAFRAVADRLGYAGDPDLADHLDVLHASSSDVARRADESTETGAAPPEDADAASGAPGPQPPSPPRLPTPPRAPGPLPDAGPGEGEGEDGDDDASSTVSRPLPSALDASGETPLAAVTGGPLPPPPSRDQPSDEGPLFESREEIPAAVDPGALACEDEPLEATLEREGRYADDGGSDDAAGPDDDGADDDDRSSWVDEAREEAESGSGEAAASSGAGEAPTRPAADDRPPASEARTSDARPMTESGNFLGPSPSDEAELNRFGRYVLIEEIGRGERGLVHLARDTETDAVVALKVVKQGALPEAERATFLRRVDSVAALEHPAVVQVHDSGVHEGCAYVAADVVVGRPLSEVCRDPAADVRRRLVPLLARVCQAFEDAHAMGVVSGGIRTRDVLVRSDGSPRLINFGLGRWTVGPGGSQDPQGDVAVVGRLVYEVAARGRAPEDAPLAARLLLGTPVAPSTLRPGAPRELDAIALRALGAGPGEPYRKVGDLRVDLERFAKGQPARVPPPGVGYRVRQRLLRHRLAVVVLLALLGLGGWGLVERDALRARALAWLDARPAGDGPPPADERPDGPEEDGEPGPDPSPDGPTPVPAGPGSSAALVALGDRLLADGELAAARLAFAEAAAAAEAPAAARGGLARAERALARERAAADARADRGRELEAEGRARLAEGDLRGARDALLEALAAGRGEAEHLLRDVTERMVERELGEAHDQSASERRARADELVAAGRGALEVKQVERAREAFLAALALVPAHADARAGLDDAGALAAELGRATILRERRREAVAGLLDEARAARGRGDRPAARRALHGVLAFDPDHAEAARLLAGLERQAAEDEARATDRRVAELLRSARASLSRARGQPATIAFEAYLEALLGVDQALALDPEDRELRRERTRVVEELSALLGARPRPRGDPDVSDGGPVDDPYLELSEADRVSIGRALGGEVRFQPTRGFDDLRAWIEGYREGRFHVEIWLRSRVDRGRVFAEGLWIRVKDKERNTITPWHHDTHPGGPHMRNTMVDERGPVIAPFYSAHSIDRAEELSRIAEVVKERVREAAAKAE